MNVFTFTAHFENEQVCREHFKSQRDKIGIIYHRCGHKNHYWIKSAWSYERKEYHKSYFIA